MTHSLQTHSLETHSGVIHRLETSTARLHDSQVRGGLLHGGEASVRSGLPLAQPLATPSDNGDGYVSAAREAAFKGPGKVWGVLRYK